MSNRKLYQHSRGSVYEVLGDALDVTNEVFPDRLKRVVVYRKVHTTEWFVRDRSEFYGSVQVGETLVPRFRRLTPSEVDRKLFEHTHDFSNSNRCVCGICEDESDDGMDLLPYVQVSTYLEESLSRLGFELVAVKKGSVGEDPNMPSEVQNLLENFAESLQSMSETLRSVAERD